MILVTLRHLSATITARLSNHLRFCGIKPQNIKKNFATFLCFLSSVRLEMSILHPGRADVFYVEGPRREIVRGPAFFPGPIVVYYG